jgi:hypothetical protein
MARIAIIENGIVANIIIGDADFASSYDGTAVVLTDETIRKGYLYDGSNFSESVKSQEEQATIARKFRNMDLESSDWIVPVTDHPEHAEWLTYRQELRDWPSTENFPDTKPSKP